MKGILDVIRPPAAVAAVAAANAAAAVAHRSLTPRNRFMSQFPYRYPHKCVALFIESRGISH